MVAFPALCLAATAWCLPKITACPRNRSSGGFDNSLCLWYRHKGKLKMGAPPHTKSKYDCNLPVKTNFLTNTWNDPMTHSFDLPLALYQKCTGKELFLSNACFLETKLAPNAWNLCKTHPISRFPAIGYVKKIRMLSVLHIGLVESSQTL